MTSRMLLCILLCLSVFVCLSFLRVFTYEWSVDVTISCTAFSLLSISSSFRLLDIVDISILETNTFTPLLFSITSSFFMCVIKICSAYAKGVWPSSSRVASCGKGDNCCLPAICLPGVVGVCHRGAAEPARAPSEGLRRCGFLPVGFPSFAALATEADLRLFKSISANPYHVLGHYFRQRETTRYSLRPRVHSFALPAKDDRNFIPLLLYGVLTQPN